MFIAEEDIKTQARAGSAWEFSFGTGLAPEWFLLSDIRARFPEILLTDLKSQAASGWAYDFSFETDLASDWLLKAHTRAARPYESSFLTEFSQQWLLKTETKARRLLRFVFATTFDPASRRLGQERLELYPRGKTDAELLVIPVNLYNKGTERFWGIDLWFGRLQSSGGPADDVRLEAFALGATNSLGKEIVEGGYLQARLTASGVFVPLSPGAYLGLGPMWPNTKKGLDFRLSVPAGAASIGPVFVGLRLESLQSVVYGTAPFGRAVFGEFKRRKPETVLLKIHIIS